MKIGRSTKFLLLSRVKKETQVTYDRGVKLFMAFLRRRGVRKSVFSLKPHSVDDYLTMFLHAVYIFKKGRCRHLGSAALHGIMLHRPELKERHKLAKARAALKGWEKLRPSVKHPPLPRFLLVVLAFFLRKNGFPVIAIAFLVAWEGLLRIGELCRIRVKDVAFTSDLRIGGKKPAVLVIKKAKTGKNQVVSIRSKEIAVLLSQVVAGKKKKQLAFGVSPRVMRKMLKRAFSSIQVRKRRWTFHSIRHGAATAALMEGMPLEEVLRRGRWKAAASARHYIQEGEALLLAADIDNAVLALGRDVDKDLVEHFSLDTS